TDVAGEQFMRGRVGEPRMDQAAHGDAQYHGDKNNRWSFGSISLFSVPPLDAAHGVPRGGLSERVRGVTRRNATIPPRRRATIPPRRRARIPPRDRTKSLPSR